MASLPLDPQRLFFADTASRFGRHLVISPTNSDLEHLHYGRIRLDAAHSDPNSRATAFETGARETALLCMKGSCRIRVRQHDPAGGTRDDDISLNRYDALYVPRGSAVAISAEAEADVVEVAAEVSGEYPLQVVRYAQVAETPSLKFSAGSDGCRRDLNIVIGSNVQAGRIVAGFTRSSPGNWTSWPPHEHASILEEAYVYFDMPAPAFGVQLVYSDPQRPEFARIVRDGDAVLMPAGYHPNVAAPGHAINFIWMMAARNEVSDRLFGVVNVQPGFGDGGSGLEASRR